MNINEWSSGYVTDVGYTYGYYSELNPLRIRLAFLNKGINFPEVGAACELGFGQGVSGGRQAAASMTQWYGTDFNPSQAAFARELIASSGAHLGLRDDDFERFGERDDLPQFDFIALHGIWSWINNDNRKEIAKFVGKKLKIGGVLYISYNTLPGWSSFAPMRHLLGMGGQFNGARPGVLERIEKGFDFVEKMIDINMGYARANPGSSDRVKKVRAQDRNYVAHEYFNRDWEPMYFSDMANWLQSSKVQYACSANYLEHVDVLNLSSEQQGLLGEISDVALRETSRDFIVNQQFRRDYWVKGIRQLTQLERAEMLRAQRVVLIAYRPDIKLKIMGSLGEANMNELIYGPLLDLLSDFKPKTLGQIERDLEGRGLNFSQIFQCVMILIGAGHLAPTYVDDGQVFNRRKQTDKINNYIIQRARGGSELNYLASPLTGGGVAVTRFPQLFLLAILQGKKQPAEWAQAAWDVLRQQGQALQKEGRTMETPEENIAELLVQASNFALKQLPVLRALMVI